MCNNCWDGEPMTGTHLLQKLNREPLQMTRGRGRLMLFFKISRGMMAMPMPSYVQPPSLQQNPSVIYHPARYIAVNWH